MKNTLVKNYINTYRQQFYGHSIGQPVLAGTPS